MDKGFCEHDSGTLVLNVSMVEYKYKIWRSYTSVNLAEKVDCYCRRAGRILIRSTKFNVIDNLRIMDVITGIYIYLERVFLSWR
jgi:hypothetical protein